MPHQLIPVTDATNVRSVVTSKENWDSIQEAMADLEK